MTAMRNKIKSQRGASITFALLVFLVCSMVSIAVVVAGTAAAGRMSQRAETDQRYYAVASAVELLCDDFKGKTVTVEYTKPVSESTVSEDDISVISIKDGDKMVSDMSKCGVLLAASKTLVARIAGIDSSSGTFSLTVEGAPANSSLACDINEYVKPDGRVTFEVCNTVDRTATPKSPVYTLQVTFDANINKSTPHYRAGGTEIEKVTITLDWDLNSIKKGAV